MRSAQGVLVRAWRRDSQGWWVFTTGLLTALLLVVVGVAGLLEGMNRETEARIADFYTGDVRLTNGTSGAAPAQFLDRGGASIQAAIQAVETKGGVLEPRLETTFILSRRSFVEAYLFEDDGYTVSAPGVAGNGEQFTAGILVGAVSNGSALEKIARHMVVGNLPGPYDNSTPLQLLMSESAFRQMLAADEFDRLDSWPPTPSQLAAVRFEITAGRIDHSSSSKDVIRASARVVGLFNSQIEALDRVTLVSTLEAAQQLMTAESDIGQVNVLVAYGGVGEAYKQAAFLGMETEAAPHFAQRYMGELMDVVRTLTLAISLLLLAFPIFLLWYGLSQLLERSQRELIVCRAIGVPPGLVVGALSWLAAGIIVTAIGVASLLVGAAYLILPSLLRGWQALPLPLGFAVPVWVVAVAASSVLFGAGLAVAGTVRRHLGRDIASGLRAS